MDISSVAVIAFWLSLISSALITPIMLQALRRMRLYHRYNRKDRKRTLYGTAATEFNRIRRREERATRGAPVSRVGGLVLLPTVILVGLGLALYLSSTVLLISFLAVTGVAFVALYDDLVDIGVIRRKSLSIARRLVLLGSVALVVGWALFLHLPHQVTFLPFFPFEGAYVGILFPLIFACWYLFWQVSSVIDGIDGLSGSVFFALFVGTGALSVLQQNDDALLLSVVAVGILIPWLFINYAPARAYLTEIGITILIMFFAVITFLLGTCSPPADGLWVGVMFGAILIATWVSNVLQLLYRKKTGKKLFRIAPLHHHFEAIGIPGPAVVSRYMLVTILCVIAGLSVVLLR